MTQGELEKIPQKAVKAMKDLEIRIMDDIVRRIRINGFSTASADWQFTRLMQLGMSEKEIKEWIRMALDVSEAEIDRIFSDKVYEEYMNQSRGYQVYGRQQVPFEENQELQQLINAVKEQTMDEFRNITETMGFVVKRPGGLMSVTLSEFYRKTLDDAMFDIHSGAFDYSTVLQRTIEDMTTSGLRWIDYESGWHNRVPVAARRAVMTGFRQVQGKINEQTARDLGTDSYEVTVHIGARPTHQPWEGKVWTMEQLHTVCGLGSVTGLHGANCYHDYNAFIPGVSVRTYTDEQLDQIHRQENTPKPYNGKEYTTYEALQRQRQLETRARKYREDVHLMEEGMKGLEGEQAEKLQEAITLKKCRYRGTMQEYNAFSDKMNLPTQKERIYQDGLKVNMRAPRKVKEDKDLVEKDLRKEDVSAKIEVPDTSRCCYRTEKDHKALVKVHAKTIDKADAKQVAKHTKADGSPGGYVATHNYQTINRALMEKAYDSLDPDDKATVDALRRAITGNTLDQDCIMTRYVNADYISSKFGVFSDDGSKLGNMELESRKSLMQKALDGVKAKLGTTISSDAFVSTSMVKGKNIMSDKSVRMTISVVKGTHCYAVKNFRESEVIFGDSTDLYITDAVISLDGKLEIYAILLE